MKLITNKSKNLLYRIVDAGNVIVQFSTSYAVVTQRTADTSSNLKFKIIGYTATDYKYLTDKLFGLGKLSITFTTPSITGFTYVLFGVNGSKIDTACRCDMNLKPSTTYTFTCNFTNITQGSISWKDMMLVEGSTVGEYEPYSYNLLDKWRFEGSQTSNGVTWTNNGDGSIIANGYATGFTTQTILRNSPINYTHKYLFNPNYASDSRNTMYELVFIDNNTTVHAIEGVTDPNIVNISNYTNILSCRINLKRAYDTILGSYTYGYAEPVFYDLTLMYGAGNEPTTVDQFYKDHPELKVSPLGFIELKNLEINNKNIKRLRYATTTRNLFNINNYSTIGSDIGFDISNLKIGKTYTMSCRQAPFTWIKISDSGNGYNSIQYQGDEIYSYTFIMSRNSNIPEGATQNLFLQMKGATSQGFAGSLSELGVNQIQIEEGSTATPYVPYGYLDLGIIPSNSGYILNKYDNLSSELLKENVEIDNVTYHIPDKTNILLNKVEGKTNKIVQLADKSKYDGTSTTRGITFTNNGNGTITINGTNDGTDYSDHPITNSNYLTNNWLKGRKYLFYFSDRTDLNYYAVIGGSTSKIEYTELGNTSTGRSPLWKILSPTDNSIGGNSWYILRVKQNATCTNELASPQVFDLTAMYGFGNEPTTIEQFKKDYPQFFDQKLNGIWNVRTSGISTTGKNLFDISKWISSPYDVANGTLVERLSNGAICQGNNGTGDGDASYSNGWFRPMIGTFPLSDVYLRAGTYTLSADYTMIENSTVNTTQVSCHLYGDNNYPGSTLISVTVGSTVKVKNTYTVEEGNYYPIFTLNSGKVKIENIQIEYGNKSTDYEPYTENKIDLLSTQTLNGINGVNDYIEVIDKGNGLYDLKKTKNIDSVDLGTLDWQSRTVSLGEFFSGGISSKDNSVAICNKYSSATTWGNDKSVFIGSAIGLTDSSLANKTVEEVKTAVTGTILYYQLNTPVVTTIAENLTYNQVSAIRTNGGLLLVNDNNNQKYAQPNVTIKSNYQYKS